MSDESITATESLGKLRPGRALLESMQEVAIEELGGSCDVEVRHDPRDENRVMAVFRLKFECCVELIPATNIQSAMYNDYQCRAACGKLRLLISDYMKGIGK